MNYGASACDRQLGDEERVVELVLFIN